MMTRISRTVAVMDFIKGTPLSKLEERAKVCRVGFMF